MNAKLFFDRSFSEKVSRQLLWLVFAIVVCLALLVGCSYMLIKVKSDYKRISEIINSFVDTGSIWKAYDGDLNHPPVFILITTTLGIVVLSGLFISTVTNMLTRREAHYLSGDTKYRLSGHYIVLGYNEMAKSLIKQLCKSKKEGGKGASCVLLTTIQDVQSVRFILRADLPSEYGKIVIMHSRRDAENDLEKLRIERAKEIYILGESNENDHDSQNIRTLNAITSILSDKHRRIKPPVYAVFDNETSYYAFQTTKLDQPWKETISFRPINLHEEWAKRLFLSKQMKGKYRSLSKNSTKWMHIVICGMNKMGIALGLEAGQMCHFPNFSQGYKTLVTFIDENASQQMDYFRCRMRHYFEIMGTRYIDAKTGQTIEYQPTKFTGKDSEFLDVKYEFVQGTTEMPEVQKILKSASRDQGELTVIAVCHENQDVSFTSAMYLPDEVYENGNLLFVYQKESSDLVNAISKSLKYENIVPFGMIKDWRDMNWLNVEGAKRINAIYEKNNEDQERLWEETSLVNQWSSLHFANHALVKKESIGELDGELSQEQKEQLSEVEHNRWNMEKLIMGFRKAADGEEDDKTDLLIHSDIKPFSELAEEKRMIDERLVSAIREISGCLKDSCEGYYVGSEACV